MTKASGIILATFLFIIIAWQTGYVLAENDDHGHKPITGPVTSPVTSPMCKPGWGFGDDNHCHFGPPGKTKKDDDNDNNQSNEDSHGHQGDNGNQGHNNHGKDK